jgi:hypothetical protein
MRAATKTLSLTYVAEQFAHYPHPLLTPLTRVMYAIAPAWVAKRLWRLPTGEVTVIASRTDA